MALPQPRAYGSSPTGDERSLLSFRGCETVVERLGQVSGHGE